MRVGYCNKITLYNVTEHREDYLELNFRIGIFEIFCPRFGDPPPPVLILEFCCPLYNVPDCDTYEFRLAEPASQDL